MIILHHQICVHAANHFQNPFVGFPLKQQRLGHSSDSLILTMDLMKFQQELDGRNKGGHAQHLDDIVKVILKVVIIRQKQTCVLSLTVFIKCVYKI